MFLKFQNLSIVLKSYLHFQVKCGLKLFDVEGTAMTIARVSSMRRHTGMVPGRVSFQSLI